METIVSSRCKYKLHRDRVRGLILSQRETPVTPLAVAEATDEQIDKQMDSASAQNSCFAAA